jgi:hypothetical protein
MCSKKLDLHKNRSKQAKPSKVKRTKKKRVQEKPCEAQAFFLMNEDVLY